MTLTWNFWRRGFLHALQPLNPFQFRTLWTVHSEILIPEASNSWHTSFFGVVRLKWTFQTNALSLVGVNLYFQPNHVIVLTVPNVWYCLKLSGWVTLVLLAERIWLVISCKGIIVVLRPSECFFFLFPSRNEALVGTQPLLHSQACTTWTITN